MADEQLDPTQPATPADQTPAPAPVPEPAPAVVPDPSPGDTPSTSPEPSAPAAGEAPAAPVATPVIVDNHTTRGDDDAQLGSWVDVVSGEYAGRFGAYFETAASDPQTGYPTVVHVRSRDARNEILTVNYSDIRPSERTGGR